MLWGGLGGVTRLSGLAGIDLTGHGEARGLAVTAVMAVKTRRKRRVS